MKQNEDEKINQRVQYIADYIENKDENNIFVKRTRENIAKEFLDDLDNAIDNPLL